MGVLSLKIPAPEDVIGCQAAIFEWAQSFDVCSSEKHHLILEKTPADRLTFHGAQTKDWERLASNTAPTLYVDYRAVMGHLWESMPAEQFVGLASSEHFLGNQRIATQHMIGASKWMQISDDEITGEHQMRVAHQKYKDDARTEVQYHGHAYGKATVQYRRVDGVWKFAGLTPDIQWSEHDYDKIFKDN